MAISTPTTSGQILTSAYVNNNINSGMVYITSGALSTATTNFVGCFTSDYTNYRIVIDNLACSGSTELYFYYLTGTTTVNSGSYYWCMSGIDSAGTVGIASANPGSAGYTGWQSGGAGGAGGVTMDIYNPNNVTNTVATISAGCKQSAGAYRAKDGSVSWDTTTAFTGIQFTSTTAVTFTGNCTIYGYRKA
jgi:hypothetical protein